ncbi:MAG: carbamoyltransferase HypF [Coriobacteriia bacterium]|nr:carbamoyltransferase HypF [Coriobacteriia bacterium]
MKAFDIHVTGVVQGVGFRPYTYRLASRFGLVGWVYNATNGVHIHIEGPQDVCLAFMQALQLETPPAAFIEHISSHLSTVTHIDDFSIRRSTGDEVVSQTLISPDLATCPSCLRELFDPTDRRYFYPFINCTDCGPRFTIINQMPYDRPLTTMRNFTMCPACEREYHDPADRRFHAQPDACFVCGPLLSLLERGDKTTAANAEQTKALLERVASALYEGRIVAIKGLGGYHLACDATNAEAVQALRQRKRRSNKPLAVMMASVDQARSYCQVNQLEAALLEGVVRPIVLLQQMAEAGAGATPQAGSRAGTTPPDSNPPAIASNVAGNLTELGVMLPSTPLQHLLFSLLDRPLVMTSGNVSEEPIIGDVEQAHQQLADIADLFVDNNRPISSRYDDSVVRVINNNIQFIRRARGYAPLPLRLPQVAEQPLLAVGAEQKNTFCLVTDQDAFISQHLGDLDDEQALRNWDKTRQSYQELFNISPRHLAADLHPEYLGSKWVAEISARHDVPVSSIQHHHAHIAAVLAEAAVAAERRRLNGAAAEQTAPPALAAAAEQTAPPALAPDQVIGFAFDGTGLGDDQTIWGGEVLIASLTDYQRVAHLRPIAMPGAAAAIREPWRITYAWLLEADQLGHPGAQKFLDTISSDTQKQLKAMITQKLNSPLTSSMGRLFDAVSALLGNCTQATYEGEPAIELEAAMASTASNASNATATGNSYSFTIDESIIDTTALLLAILDDIADDVPTASIALKFHQAIIAMVCMLASQLSEQHGLGDIALSGGVFMNRYLSENLPPALESAGFTVYTNRDLPPNDGCIAYGQAAVAIARQRAARSPRQRAARPTRRR